MLEIKSIFTKKLTRFEISEICRLKNTHWKFGYKSQFQFYKKNVKKNDLNNLLIKNKKIIGYTLLRIRKKNNRKFIIFDTLIINQKFRKSNYSYILMEFNNFIIKNLKCPAYLICEKNLVKFYKKFNWIKNNYKKNKVQMSFNS